MATAELNRAIGIRLAAVRTALGLSQNAFAVSLGLSPRAYVNYERGEREVTATALLRLHEIHEVDPLWMLAGVEDKPVYAYERKLNMELFTKLLQLVDGALRRTHKTLPPDRKAKLIALAYAHCVRAGEMDAKEVRSLLALAA